VFVLSSSDKCSVAWEPLIDQRSRHRLTWSQLILCVWPTSRGQLSLAVATLLRPVCSIRELNRSISPQPKERSVARQLINRKTALCHHLFHVASVIVTQTSFEAAPIFMSMLTLTHDLHRCYQLRSSQYQRNVAKQWITAILAHIRVFDVIILTPSWTVTVLEQTNPNESHGMDLKKTLNVPSLELHSSCK